MDPTEAYNEAIAQAARLLLAALRDHTRPEISVRLLEAMRVRDGAADEGRRVRREDVRAVFADINKLATVLLSEELRDAALGAAVEAEMRRSLRRLLASAEDMFRSRIDDSRTKQK